MFRSRESPVPKRYVRAAAIVGPLAALAFSGSGLHGTPKALVAVCLACLPTWLLEVSWRARERRREERLLPWAD
jgi:hypothetical protein